MVDGAAGAFVGRERETTHVRGILDAVRAGSASTLLVTGNAGVGKTTLITHVLDSLGDGWTILVGGALPLGSMTVPFLSLRTALRAVGEDPRIPPSPLGVQVPITADMPVAFDEWIDRLTDLGPVALLVDDLHWADESTLDVLMYLIAGRRTRRMCLLTTVRRGEVREGHPLNGWLADVRRMPGFTVLTLDPLDRLATGRQVAATLGVAPHESLVDEVYAKARGNCYFTRLLVLGLDPAARGLPRDYPDDLKTALLANWHRLSIEARELTTVLAVAGRRMSAPEMAKLVTGELPTGDLAALFHAAVDYSVLDLDPTGSYWFHHPLQAEVLEENLPADERRRWHERIAGFLEDRFDGSTDVESLVHVADHHFAAGHVDEAYTTALRAAEFAASAGGHPEAIRLLRRAVELHPRVPSPREKRSELLRRLRAAASEVGDHASELAAVQGLIREPVLRLDPEGRAELLVRQVHLQFSLGKRFFDPADAEEAVRVAAASPDSWQRAYALAELAHTRMWNDLPGVGEAADAAVLVAERAGHPVGLAYACASKAIALMFEGHVTEARDWAGRGCAEAARARDWWAFSHATFWELNATGSWMTPGYLDGLTRRRRELETLGAPHPYVAWLASAEAATACERGELALAQGRVNVALSAAPGILADMGARLTAARLALLAGRSAEARPHLDRAEELASGRMSVFRNMQFDAVRAELLLAEGNSQLAYESCLNTLDQPGVVPTMCEWLVPLAGRALADLATSGSSRVTSPATASLRDAFEERFPPRDAGSESWAPVVDDFFSVDHALTDVAYVRFLKAFSAWYAAESARGHRSPHAAQRWEEAAGLLDGAGAAWEAAYAWSRTGEAHVVLGRGHRSDAARALREASVRATSLSAEPLMRRVAELAVSARIRLDTVRAPGTEGDGVPGLTLRESEILGHVVAGRTYAEVAEALFISEKTVSTHISNMLRKTNTANRHELAQLARSARDDGRQHEDPHDMT